MKPLKEPWTIADAREAMTDLGWYLQHRDPLIRTAHRYGLTNKREMSRLTGLAESTIARILGTRK